MRHMRRFPILTVATPAASALVTATRLFSDGPLDALRRGPTALDQGADADAAPMPSIASPSSMIVNWRRR
jgi:hypothetical protein